MLPGKAMKFTVRSLSVLLFATLVSSAACSHYARLQVTDPPPVALTVSNALDPGATVCD